VVATVSGGGWRVTCAGRTVSGLTWYRISAVNGRSVSSLYGVSYVYAASGLFGPVPTTTRVAACAVSLRTAASTTAPRKTSRPAGVDVTVIATVKGGGWRVTCAGRTVSGSTWYRITAIAGRKIESLYGVPYLYVATGLFTTITEGIDVSHWQGSVDWGRVRAAGKRFVYIKASEGRSSVDSRYGTNRSRAASAGLYVGAYHFARPDASRSDAVAEADHFVAAARIRRGDLLPVLDLEVTGGLSTTALQGWVRSFLGRVYERTRVRAVIYVSPTFWKRYMGDTTWFARNGYGLLWDAHWTTASQPSVPADGWGGRGWTFWQYTSGGTVPGIAGRVDLNRYRGTDFARVLVR
jgi:GH25 family lysozyme M1 (1,4-beta-N-acetylmuramidase)